MKYIRTNILGEEDIYFINDIFLDVDRIYLSNKKSNIAVDICSKKDLEILGKISNNIEELCDEFVSINTIIDSELLKKTIDKEPTKEHKQVFRRFVKDLTKKPLLEGFREYDENDKFKIMKSLREHRKKIGIEYLVYGAIWTDKGLIFIAHMNSKGELELL